MNKKRKYVDSVFNEISETVGWDLISEKELLMNFIAENDLADDFLNYVEKVAEEERQNV